MEEGRRSIEITSPMHRKVQLLSDFLLLMFIILIFFSIFMAIVLYAKCYYEEEGRAVQDPTTRSEPSRLLLYFRSWYWASLIHESLVCSKMDLILLDQKKFKCIDLVFSQWIAMEGMIFFFSASQSPHD